MTESESRRAEFLIAAGWENAHLLPLAGDASSRQYFRAIYQGKSVILMDGSTDETAVANYISVTRLLRDHGLSAPQIYHASGGLLLLEDLGDDLFARFLEQSPETELRLYENAIDVLEVLRHIRSTDRPCYSAGELSKMATEFSHFYAQKTPGYAECLEKHLSNLPSDRCLALRDYHAENLVWLPDRTGVAKTGLLDFQDAMMCHPVYDLVSLLTDARRDIPPELAQKLVDQFARKTGSNAGDLGYSIAILAAQRNLRILGIFARLSKVYGKRRYIDLIPRVWGHLMRALDHPELKDLAQGVFDSMPAPDPGHLQGLRQ